MGEKTVLYRYFDNDDSLLYVGISNNFILRLYQHERNSHWVDEIKNITLERFSNRPAALASEYDAIRSENPIHNKRCDQPPMSLSIGNKTICIDQDIDEIVDKINEQSGKLSTVVCSLLRIYRDRGYRFPDKSEPVI